jgi:hypothetical protein
LLSPHFHHHELILQSLLSLILLTPQTTSLTNISDFHNVKFVLGSTPSLHPQQNILSSATPTNINQDDDWHCYQRRQWRKEEHLSLHVRVRRRGPP